MKKGYTVVTLSATQPEFEPYRNMVTSFFLRSLRSENDWFHSIDPETYWHIYHCVIQAVLSRKETEVRLALLPEDLDTALGFSLSEGHRLHYVFVKSGIAARRQGIGTALLPDAITHFTHLTGIGSQLWKKKYPEWKFNPFL